VLSSTSFATEQTIIDSNNQFSAKFVLKKLAYEENGTGIFALSGQLLDTEKGYIPGYGLGISFMGKALLDKDYLDIEFSHSIGHTDYIGSIIGSGAGFGSATDTSSARILDLSGRVGEGFSVGQNFMLTPFLELGYHKWARGVNAGETYTHNYWGGGLLAQTSIGNKFVLSLNGMIGRTFSSQIEVFGTTGFTGDLGNSINYRFGASVDYAVTKMVHFSFGVDHTRFKYGISKLFPVPGFPGFVQGEPESKSRYTVFNAGVGLAF
jgi:hypothetical protein